MNKSQTRTSLFLELLPTQKKSTLFKLYRPPQSNHHFPSPQETHKRDQYLQKLHKWRKESKLSKLQQTYDENCRIFISLKNQKSQYKLPKQLTTKKTSYLKLAPLTDRIHKIAPLSARNINKQFQPKANQPPLSHREAREQI